MFATHSRDIQDAMEHPETVAQSVTSASDQSVQFSVKWTTPGDMNDEPPVACSSQPYYSGSTVLIGATAS